MPNFGPSIRNGVGLGLGAVPTLSSGVRGNTPALVLNFLTGTLSPLITFTRASSATYFDSTGTLRTATTNTPRFDYNPSTLAALGLLIEEQRTNSIRNNTMQDAVAGTPGTLPTNWLVGSAVGLTTNVIAVGTENGVSYVDLQIVGTSSGSPYNLFFDANTQIAASAAQVWSGSAYLKLIAGSYSNIVETDLRIQPRTSAGAALSANDVAFVATSSMSRTTNSYTLPATSAYVQMGVRIGVTVGQAIDITLRIGLPQLELGAFATSVIPTTTAAATRSADVASMTGTNFSSWYNASEGTFFNQSASPASSQYIQVVSDGTANNRMLMQQGTNTRNMIITTGGVAQASISAAATYGVLTKAAGAYKTDSAQLAASGILGVEDASVSVPTVDRMFIGSNFNGTASYLNGWITRIAYYPRRLSNAELQAITS